MQRLSNSNLTESCANASDKLTRVTDMPDPEDIYSLTIGGADTSASYVHAPNICDHDGAIIQPSEYERKILDGTIVMVNTSLKM